jgi:hypothetical protein
LVTHHMLTMLSKNFAYKLSKKESMFSEFSTPLTISKISSLELTPSRKLEELLRQLSAIQEMFLIRTQSTHFSIMLI